MNFRLGKIQELSGRGASVYTVVLDGESSSVFEQFIAEYDAEYSAEIEHIAKRLYMIGHKFGAREGYF